MAACIGAIKWIFVIRNKLINNRLKSNILPSWNFGPKVKNCKNVEYITKILLNNWKKSI